MKIQALKTRKFLPPKDDLFELPSESIKSLDENSIVVIASKVVSIFAGRTIPVGQIDKDELIISESQKYLPRDLVPNGWVIHTIKNNILLPSAGVDESNGAGYYILWPEDPTQSAEKIGKFLAKKFNLKNLGIIISDLANIEFVEKYVEPTKPNSSYNVKMGEDLYAPFLNSVPWKKGDKR